MPSGLILSEGKTPTYTWKKVDSVIDGQHRRRPNESRDTDSLSTKCQQPSRRTDERVEVRATSCA